MGVFAGGGDPKKVTVAGGINEEGVKGEAWKGEKEDF